MLGKSKMILHPCPPMRQTRGDNINVTTQQSQSTNTQIENGNRTNQILINHRHQTVFEME